MQTTTKDAMIFYTTDGSTPTRSSKIYFEPITLSTAATIKAFTYFSPGNESPVVEAVFKKRPNDWTVRVISPYSTQYTGGGGMRSLMAFGARQILRAASGRAFRASLTRRWLIYSVKLTSKKSAPAFYRLGPVDLDAGSYRV